MPPKPGSGSSKALDPCAGHHLADAAEVISPRDPRRVLAAVAMLERLAEHWSLRGDEREMLLGGIPKSTWSEWRQRPRAARIKSDTRERIANLFTIDLNAHALFAAEFADRWVREPNAAFGGASPISTMLRGKVEDIITVRRYLERIRTSSPNETMPAAESSAADKPYTTMDHLRFVVRAYERFASRDPRRFRPALASALNTLATSLEVDDHAAALPVMRRAVEVLRNVASEQMAYKVELIRSLFHLGELLSTVGNENEASSVIMEARRLVAGLSKTGSRLAARERAPSDRQNALPDAR
jgi:hypothetical protein